MASELERLLWIVRCLRAHCAWTAELTHGQLAQYMIEEAYEAVEVIETDHLDLANLGTELSDVLFQVVLHAQLAEEDGRFNFDDVAGVLSQKMIRRNPHVFTPDGQLRPPAELDQLDVEEIAQQWEAIKRVEKATETNSSSHSASAVKPGPALATAQVEISRATRGGQPAPDTRGLTFADEAALANHLLAVAAAAEEAGLDAEAALRNRLRKTNET